MVKVLLKNLKYKIDVNGDHSSVTLNGWLAENIDDTLNQLTTELTPKVVFDFEGITATNSFGIRSWMVFTKNIQEGRQVSYIKCPNHVIDIINLVPAFLGTAKIDSAFATFTCQKCDFEENILFQRGQNIPPQTEKVIFKKACRRCQGDLEMDEEYQAFFNWLGDDISEDAK